MTRFLAFYGTKGGVGKSTIATNIAYALHAAGSRVALIDLDISGPNVPKLVSGLDGRAPVMREFRVVPGRFGGVDVSSVGFFTEPDETPFLAGRYVAGALKQMLFYQEWEDQDIVVLDMPPGFDELHRSVFTRLPVETVLVTTPHALSQHDLARGIHLLRHIGTKVRGIVENMSHIACRHCGESSPLFQAAELPASQDIPVIASIPFSPEPPHSGAGAVPLFLVGDPSLAEFRSGISKLAAKLTESG